MPCQMHAQKEPIRPEVTSQTLQTELFDLMFAPFAFDLLWYRHAAAFAVVGMVAGLFIETWSLFQCEYTNTSIYEFFLTQVQFTLLVYEVRKLSLDNWMGNYELE